MRYCVLLLLGGLLGAVYGCGSAGPVVDSLSNNTSGDQVKGAKLSELKREVPAEPPATEALTPEAAAPSVEEAKPAEAPVVESAPLPEEYYYTSAKHLCLKSMYFTTG